MIKKSGNIITNGNIPQIEKIKKIASKKKINLNLIQNKKRGIKLISHNFENEKQLLKIRYEKSKNKILN